MPVSGLVFCASLDRNDSASQHQPRSRKHFETWRGAGLVRMYENKNDQNRPHALRISPIIFSVELLEHGTCRDLRRLCFSSSSHRSAIVLTPPASGFECFGRTDRRWLDRWAKKSKTVSTPPSSYESLISESTLLHRGSEAARPAHLGFPSSPHGNGLSTKVQGLFAFSPPIHACQCRTAAGVRC